MDNDTTLDLFTQSPESPIQTMSSKMIAEIANKLHKNVLADIRVTLCNLFPKYGVDPKTVLYEEKAAANSLESMTDLLAVANSGVVIVKDNLGDVAEILLPFDETVTVIAKYDDVLRRKIIKQWRELRQREAKPPIPQLPDFNDPEAAALALAEMATQAAQAYAQQRETAIRNAALEHQHAENAPKVYLADMIANSDGWYSLEQVAKPLDLFDYGRNRMTKFLKKHHVLMQDCQPYQKYVDLKYFRSRWKPIPDGRGGERMYPQTLVSGKGIAFIVDLLRKHQEDLFSGWEVGTGQKLLELQRNVNRKAN